MTQDDRKPHSDKASQGTKDHKSRDEAVDKVEKGEPADEGNPLAPPVNTQAGS